MKIECHNDQKIRKFSTLNREAPLEMPPVLELFLLRRFLMISGNLAPLEVSMQKVFEQKENDSKENT